MLAHQLVLKSRSKKMYTWEQINVEEEGEEDFFRHPVGGAEQLIPVDQFRIMDPEGDEIAVVFSQGEAEALVSHLNR
jgi:hypothetical protein